MRHSSNSQEFHQAAVKILANSFPENHPNLANSLLFDSTIFGSQTKLHVCLHLHTYHFSILLLLLVFIVISFGQLSSQIILECTERAFDKYSAIFLINPNNPTNQYLTRDQLEKIVHIVLLAAVPLLS